MYPDLTQLRNYIQHSNYEEVSLTAADRQKQTYVCLEKSSLQTEATSLLMLYVLWALKKILIGVVRQQGGEDFELWT